jgi:hypothetical protein
VLVCNCRRVVRRGDGPFAEFRVVKSRKWDCPSCGHDKKRTLAEMCRAAGAVRIVTLTLEQPRAVWVGSERTPGDAPDGVWLSLTDEGRLVPGQGWHRTPLHRPERHVKCDPSTHIAWNVRHGGYRWRVVPECKHCLAWLSRAFRLWVMRMRDTYPDFEYLQVREVHKSGGVHLHVAVTGINRSVVRRSRAAHDIGRKWSEVGGGFVDVGKPGDHPGESAGWYVGKYLAKAHEDSFAKGYRRWTRSLGFAAEVRMGWTPPEGHDGGWDDPGAALKVCGWVHPDGVERGHRWWYFLEDNRAARRSAERSEAGLDSSTANCSDFPRKALQAWHCGDPLAATRAVEPSPEVVCPLVLF